MIKKPKYIYVEILFIFLLSLIPIFWLKGNSVLLGHDSGFRPSGFLHLYNTFFSWTSIANFGFDWTLYKGFLITLLPEATFTFLLGSLHYGEIATFVFWFFIMSLSMYVFVWNFFPEKKHYLMRIFSSIFYAYNFFILQGWFIAERAKFSLFAALPLGLLIIFKSLGREISIVKGSIFLSLLFFFLNGGGFPSLYAGVILVYAIAFIYLTAINIINKGYQELIHSFKTAISFLLVFIAVNIYWVLPQIYLAKNTYITSLNSQGGLEGVLAWEAVISKSASFINLFRLQGIPDWYDNLLHPYSNFYLNNPILIIGSFIPFLLILLGLLIKTNIKKTKEKNIVNLIFIVFFTGLIFSAGSHPPTGKFYTFLIQYFPGFAIFRSALYKFGPALWFSEIFLSSYFLNLLITTFVKKRKISLILSFFSIFLILAYNFPFFQGYFFEWNKPFTTRVKLPDYVVEMSQYISKNVSNTSRILLVPELHPYYKSDSYDWGFWSLLPLPHTLSPKSFISNDVSGDQNIGPELYEAINKKNLDLFNKLAGIAGVSNFLWRGDALYMNKLIGASDLIEQKKTIENELNASLVKNAGKWNFYSFSNKYYVPQIYSSLETGALTQDFDIGDILKTTTTELRFTTAYSQYGLIPPISDREFIDASCNYCDEGPIEKMQGDVRIPNTQRLPDSLLAFIDVIKEWSLTSKFGKLGDAQKIDVLLSLSSTKLAQDVSLLKRGQTERTAKLHKDISESYKKAVSDEILYTDKLPQESKSAYYAKIAAYLSAQKKYLSNNKTYFPTLLFADLYQFVTEKLSFTISNLWVSDETHKRYEFDIETSDEYSLNISQEFAAPKKIFIDGQIVEDTSKISFKKGYHRLELEYPETDNELENFTIPSAITLRSNQAYTYKIKKFDPESDYLIELTYKRIAGSFGQPLKIFQWKDKVGGTVINKREFSLDARDYFDKISLVLSPEPGARDLSITFSTPYFSFDDTVIQVESFNIRKTLSPKVVFTRNIVAPKTGTPKISFKRINPTKYAVHIENATNPFMLIFGENFNPAWKIYYPKDSQVIQEFNNTNSVNYFNSQVSDYSLNDYILDPLLLTSFFAKKLPEEYHYKTNGYSNGWYINRTGSYDLIIEYNPQRLVYLGVLISGISVATCIFYLIMKKKHGKN